MCEDVRVEWFGGADATVWNIRAERDFFVKRQRMRWMSEPARLWENGGLGSRGRYLYSPLRST